MKLTDLLLLGAAGVVVMLFVQNWKHCTATSYVVDANGRQITDIDGNLLVSPNPCGGAVDCHTVSTSRAPAPSCLLNPFPGGL